MLQVYNVVKYRHWWWARPANPKHQYLRTWEKDSTINYRTLCTFKSYNPKLTHVIMTAKCLSYHQDWIKGSGLIGSFGVVGPEPPNYSLAISNPFNRSVIHREIADAMNATLWVTHQYGTHMHSHIYCILKANVLQIHIRITTVVEIKG